MRPIPTNAECPNKRTQTKAHVACILLTRVDVASCCTAVVRSLRVRVAISFTSPRQKQNPGPVWCGEWESYLNHPPLLTHTLRTRKKPPVFNKRGTPSRTSTMCMYIDDYMWTLCCVTRRYMLRHTLYSSRPTTALRHASGGMQMLVPDPSAICTSDTHHATRCNRTSVRLRSDTT